MVDRCFSVWKNIMPFKTFQWQNDLLHASGVSNSYVFGEVLIKQPDSRDKIDIVHISFSELVTPADVLWPFLIENPHIPNGSQYSRSDIFYSDNK